MTFLHAAFLGGTLAIVVPIVLHMIMRKQPKHLEFPALRFIQLRENANRRQVRLRHWLLLALRSALILLLALALARPSIVASGVLGDQEAPVAAALVFDTNPRMQYRRHNQTRLEVAQETAAWLLPQLPPESDVAVVDSRTGTAAFAVDARAARQRIEHLDAGLMSQPLALAVESAIRLVGQSGKPRKEIYVFTDLSRAAWSRESMRDLAARLKEHTGIGVYLIDVGVTEPNNFGFGETRQSAQVLTANSPLVISADVLRSGPAGERNADLFLVDRKSGKADIRGRQSIEAGSGGAQRVDFQLRGLPKGIHQGYLKIAGEDALDCDDTHWFTVEVRPAWRVLIAAPSDSGRKPEDHALFFSEALAPYAMRKRGEAAFECDVIGFEQLADKSLDTYGAVCLIDPRPLEQAVWQKLRAYVSAGGGLGIFLGRHATPVESFNEPVAQELLPGKLARQWRSEGDVYLAPDDFGHPVLAKFRSLRVAWQLLPVFRHWQLEELADGAATVAVFSNNRPAIVDRPVGRGRVITMTTPISDEASRPDERGYVPWNLIATGDDKFPFYLLANTMAEYLVGEGTKRLNYTAGSTAVVPLEAGERHPIYVLTTPRGDQMRTPPGEGQEAIVVTSTEAPGNYRIQAGGGEQEVDLGFSVNLPQSVSQLDRAGQDDLKLIFGETPFRLARSREEIDRSVSAGRVGQELFPYLIVLMAVVLGCEQVLANRFYQDYDTSITRSRAAQLASLSIGPEPQPQRAPVALK
ncbi:MAG: BatA domain-containing protein [Pirellulales bacterium]